MSNAPQDADVRDFVDRILALQDGRAAEIRNLNAEAKGCGLDKTALGKVVTIVRKRGRNPEAHKRQEALVGEYLAAYEREPPARACA